MSVADELSGLIASTLDPMTAGNPISKQIVPYAPGTHKFGRSPGISRELSHQVFVGAAAALQGDIVGCYMENLISTRRRVRAALLKLLRYDDVP